MINPLQDFIDKNEIPFIEEPPITFLEIARQPHYENVISNIYSFYFDTEAEHNLKDLFISSLLECIETQLNQLSKSLEYFENYLIETEYSSDKNGRIDLLLYNDYSAIIIENKIYHHLNNDLNDYWQSITSSSANKRDDDKCIGIILSLNEIKVSHPHFINVTHKILLDYVMKNIGSYLMGSNDKYLTFLKDFFQNISNMSTKTMEFKDFEFYFKNQEEINQLTSFKKKVRNYIVKEVENAGKTLENVEVEKLRKNSSLEKKLRYYTSEENKGLMFTVLFNKLMNNEQKLIIIIEFKGDVFKLSEELENIIPKDSYEELEFNTNKQSHFLHFATKQYHLKNESIYKLSDFILDKLKEDGFIKIFNKLNNFLNAKKSVK